MFETHFAAARIGCKALFLVVLALLVIIDQSAGAQTETVLYRFCSQPNCADGARPYSGVIMDAEGNLYGTTFFGGIPEYCSPIAGATGCGVIFEVSATGTENVLHTFTGGADGVNPSGGLIQGANNNLYGTTAYGGSHNSPCKEWGCGTVFEMVLTGTEAVLYSFKGAGDGDSPSGNLLFDTHGNLFGTTQSASGRWPYKAGVVFKLAPDASETVLHTFPAYKGDGNIRMGSCCSTRRATSTERRMRVDIAVS